MFEIDTQVRLLAYCHWQTDSLHRSTVLLIHGLEGSSDSRYMLGTGAKAFRAGFNVIRLNMRTCGGTEGLTPTLYHCGLSSDLRVVVKELIEQDHLPAIFLIGFSMGGNIVLKLAGEYAGAIPSEVRGFGAVSPAVDLIACAEAVKHYPNWLYEQYILRRLRRRVRTKHKIYPELYDTNRLHLIRTMRDFDDRYIAPENGFRDADDYYQRASALPLLKHIRKPSLIIHAQDDPVVPFEPFRHRAAKSNPNVLLLAPEHGGHVGFVAADEPDEDHFWAENRVIEFCQLMEDHS